jgi:hypothetical protein
MYFDVQDYSAAVPKHAAGRDGRGYATVWLDGCSATRPCRKDRGAFAFAKEQHMNVSVILPIGVPEETGKQNDRLPFEQRAGTISTSEGL